MGGSLGQTRAPVARGIDPSKQQLPMQKQGVVDIDEYDLPPAGRTRKRGERREDIQDPARPSIQIGQASARQDGQPKRRGRPPGSQKRKQESAFSRTTVGEAEGRTATKVARLPRAKPRSRPDTAPNAASPASKPLVPSIHQQHVLNAGLTLRKNVWVMNRWDWIRASRFINIGIEQDFAALANMQKPANPRIEEYRDMGLRPGKAVVPGEYVAEGDRADAHLDDSWQDLTHPETNPNSCQWSNEETSLFADAFDADSFPEGFDVNVPQPDPSEDVCPTGPASVTFSSPAKRASERPKAKQKRMEANEALFESLAKYHSPEDGFIDFVEPREEIPRSASVERRMKRMEAVRQRYRAPQASTDILAQAELSSTNDRFDAHKQTPDASRTEPVTRSGSA